MLELNAISIPLRGYRKQHPYVMMKSIRIKLYVVTILLLVAIGLGAMIHFNCGFSFSTPEETFHCGTSSIDSYTVSTNMEGRELFSSNCASCHAIHKNLTGPALENFPKRFPMEDFKLFMHKPNKAIKKHLYLQLLAEKYNNTTHYAFPSLTDADLANITEYIKQSSRR